MLRRSLAWAAIAVVSVVLLGDPRPGVARAQQPDAIGQPDVLAIATTHAPAAELLDVPITEAPAAVEPVATAAAPEAPTAPDTSVAVTQPVQPAAPAVEAAPVVPIVVAAPPPPPPATCPSNWFCYPRLGIAGPIVPYGDCSASTDVGTAIRSITCVSPTYLAAHAYTQFGRITGWRAGDIVFAFGVRYILYDGFSQGSCALPTRAIAPLSLQTSLSTTACGPVLVVQGRPG